jgi:hypothetical protein
MFAFGKIENCDGGNCLVFVSMGWKVIVVKHPQHYHLNYRGFAPFDECKTNYAANLSLNLCID